MHMEQVKCQFSSQCHFSLFFHKSKSTQATTWRSSLRQPYLARWWHWQIFSGSPVEPLRFLLVDPTSFQGMLWPSHSRCKEPKKKKKTHSYTVSIFYFGAMRSCLFVKCYSHDMVVCAVNVWGCILEHLWIETWQDSNQFQVEPNQPVAIREAQEMWTDDGKGPIHHAISHNRLENRDLSNYDTGGFKYHTSLHVASAPHRRKERM